MNSDKLSRQLRLWPSNNPKFRWRIPNVDPNVFSPTSLKSECVQCPAKHICTTHNYIAEDGFHSERFILAGLTPELIALAAKGMTGIGSSGLLNVTAEDITNGLVAPLLPCTASEQYFGRPLQPKDHDHWIRATFEPDPLVEMIRKKGINPPPHYSEDI